MTPLATRSCWICSLSTATREEAPIPVAIETSRGLLVSVLRTGKRPVFAINPMAAARYRDRHSVSRKKSDPGDALVLANVLRTDMHAHRPLPQDSDLARAVAVLARAQQDATWNRQQIANQLRSLLREYYPAALMAVESWKNGLCRPEAHQLLKLAPTPAKAARLTRTQLQTALKRVGRQRGIAADTERFREAFRAEWTRQPQLVEDALGWRPPAPPLTASLRRLKRHSRSTRTLRSSSVSPASAPSSAPGYLPRLGTTDSGSPTPRLEGLRRRISYHPGVWQEVQRHPTLGEERPPQPCWIPLGVLRDHSLAGGQGPLPATTRQPRRLARLRPAQPLQPHDRPALPLPPAGRAL